MDALHGMVRVAVDVYTTAPAGTLITMNMENELLAASVDASQWQVGRHSFYQAETTTSGQWETLEFNYNFRAALGDWANNLVSASFNAVDQLVFLITPNQASGGTFYFDNFRVMAYNKDAPVCVGSHCNSTSSSSQSSQGSTSSVSFTSSQPASSASSASSAANCNNGCITLGSNSLQASLSRGDIVDIHFTVNQGPQQNVRMTRSGSQWHYIISGLQPGDVVSVGFTVITNHVGENIPWQSYTLPGQ